MEQKKVMNLCWTHYIHPLQTWEEAITVLPIYILCLSRLCLSTFFHKFIIFVVWVVSVAMVFHIWRLIFLCFSNGNDDCLVYYHLKLFQAMFITLQIFLQWNSSRVKNFVVVLFFSYCCWCFLLVVFSLLVASIPKLHSFLKMFYFDGNWCGFFLSRWWLSFKTC
jgi:hypothetical protein